MSDQLPRRAIVGLSAALIIAGVLLLIISAHRLIHGLGIVALYAGYVGFIWIARRRSNGPSARRSAQWRGLLLALGLLTCVATITSTVLNTAGAFYKPPQATRRTIEVKSVQSNDPVPGDSSSLTTLPYVVIGYGGSITYAASNTTVQTIRHGGRFSCTITKPINDQIERAADCTRAAHRS